MCKNIVQKGTVYYFRLNIPTDLQPFFPNKNTGKNKTVIMKNLNTGDKRKASKFAGSLALQWKAKFVDLRTSKTKAIDPAVLEYDLHTHLDRLQADDKLKRAEPKAPAKFPNLTTVPGQSAHELNQTSKSLWLSELQSCLTNNDFSLIQDEIEIFMRRNGYAYPQGTLEYNQIARGIIETHIRLNTLSQRRDAGDVLGGDFVQAITKPPAQKKISVDVDSVKAFPLSELIPDFIDSGDFAVTTKTKYNEDLQNFMEIIGDISIGEIGHDTMREFRNALKQLPKAKNKSPLYREKSIAELLETDIPKKDRLSARTVTNKIMTISSFFKWAILEGYMETNFAKGKGIRGAKSTTAIYQRFSTQDLTNIFTDKRYVNDTHNKHWHFWTPLLALYTGARQSALAALHCDDLRQTEDEIWYLHIRKDKTPSGKRDIPLHDFIIKELNFPAFVQQQKAKGHETIFQIKPKNDRDGQRISDWWTKTFTPKINISPAEEGRKKVFHSFRSCLINAAKQNGASTRKLEETVGHSDSTGTRQMSMSKDYYADYHAIKARYEDVIKPLNFVVEGMGHLRRSKYVVK
ncbi:integrase [Pseudodesulfovibrio nedwellii]|uniref:Integrase n=1 Tax=Pseudodesulfovibrio nedwellii TaxID=2973072 RepID=A0ABM8AXB0_9BACT|nr:DUF6538 domain-containing protein [Pseudodesulfovibrio nedwellii]BDQ36162.1 integrase [Pseudodesulfovibrio nedwellii]